VIYPRFAPNTLNCTYQDNHSPNEIKETIQIMAKSPRKKNGRDDDQMPGPENIINMFGGGPPPSMDQMMAGLTKMIEEQGITSEAELNALLTDITEGRRPFPSFEPSTPLEKAQQLVYKAQTMAHRIPRIELAREAIELSTDCADAYTILAEDAAQTWDEALAYYHQAVEAGKRAIGADAFEEHTGHFWLAFETRPYMRARDGLANCLWLMDRRDEAVEHLEDMLRLNPNDNQGMRYTLLECYIRMDKFKEAEMLLKQYKDEGSANWLYNWAYVLFRVKGRSLAATKKLKQALRQNPFVPEYLLQIEMIPLDLPPYVGFGDETEAQHYAANAFEFWLKHEDSLDWLEEIAEEMDVL
jgi:tetratricopeptide (TPR) repeat protein